MRLSHVILWLLIVVVAGVGMWAAYGVLNAVNVEPAAKAIDSQCSAAASASVCLDALVRLNKIQASSWLDAAAIAFAGLGTAFGLGLIVLAFTSVDGTRLERDRRTMFAAGLTVVGTSGVVLIAALVVRSL